MTSADRAVRWSSITAVSVVALVAAFVSYRHALQVVRAHGESGTLVLACPLTIDGLIFAASMMLLNAARQGIRAHWLAYGARSPGIVATLAANVAAGLSRRHHLNVPSPTTPESPSRLHSRIVTASMAFAVNNPARLSLRCLTTRRASPTSTAFRPVRNRATSYAENPCLQ